MVAILISPSGNHTAADWASVSAKKIFNTEQLSNGRLQLATEIQQDIAANLATIYQAIMDREQQRLRATLPRVMDSTVIAHHTTKEIQVALANTEWAPQILTEEWADNASAVLENHILTIQHLEQRYHEEVSN